MSRLNTLRLRSYFEGKEANSFRRIAIALDVNPSEPKEWYYSLFPRGILKHIKKLLYYKLKPYLKDLGDNL